MMHESVYGFDSGPVKIPSIELFLENWRRALPPQLKLNQVILTDKRNVLHHFALCSRAFTRDIFQCASHFTRSLTQPNASNFDLLT
jgi:hypothetical protein